MSDAMASLEQELEDLKREFELYFMGLEKRQPTKTRERLAQQIRRHNPGKETVDRFKHQNLLQRLMTYERYWERTLKAIENGTYERDIRKANRREAERGISDNQKPRTEAEEAQAAKRAQAVSDEASDFLNQLLGGGAPMRGPSMRGAAKVSAAAPRMRGASKAGASLAPGMRGASKAGASLAPSAPSMRGAPRAEAPKPPVAPSAAPPMRGAPRAEAPK
ncbi:hypothetical protein KKB55_03185, partial [Myxococcota bacterium]|nr:hypothetical protein [Myxococcota bacterium]